jgi:hypothetical protein
MLFAEMLKFSEKLICELSLSTATYMAYGGRLGAGGGEMTALADMLLQY